MIISRSVFLRIRRVSDKSCGENQNTHLIFNNVLSNIVPFMRECGERVQSRAGHRWQYGAQVPKATNTHSEYITLIAFPLQQWLHESA